MARRSYASYRRITYLPCNKKGNGAYLASSYGLTKDSVLLLEQIRTLDKRRLRDKIGVLDDKCMENVNQALLISLGF